MEKRLECFREFILENTGKDTFFYLSPDIVSDFFDACKLMNYSTPEIIYEDYYDLSPISYKALEHETYYDYKVHK